MNVSQVLAAADARLTPETWTQRMRPDAWRAEKRCAYVAIDGATYDVEQRRAAQYLFARVVSGTPSLSAIWRWNDQNGRTLAEVHQAFAAAIAIALEQEQEQPVPEAELC